jgi:two-component system, OmpR family, phosphate regulon sensor histidine kinase PhoR
MPRLSLTLRAFVALLLAALPPLVLLLVLDVANQRSPQPIAFSVAALAVIAACVGWSAIIAVLVAGTLGQEIRDLLHLAERGGAASTDLSRASAESSELDARSLRLTQALDERNRQVSELASQVSAAPISDDPRQVAEHVVRTVRSVTNDPTWLLAVLDSQRRGSLPPGAYGASDASAQPAELNDQHRWATVAIGKPSGHRARRADGPWGAFMVVDVAADEQLRAILMAPWEGRPQPSAAELDLLSLVGQQAATAIEHALLFATVREQADELERMGVIQRDFLRAVSHDLQTPLASIRALANDLRSRPGLDPTSAADLDLIEYQADRLRRMVQQLLAMSRLEAGVLEPRQEVLSPRPIVERTWAALRAGDRPLEVEVSGPALLLVADPDRLEQVLWAVLDNAVKYSPPGAGVEISIAAVDSIGSRAVISISDHGLGMDPEAATHAFEQFYRADQARRIAPDGSGIGLYTARGLMEAMGGSVSLSSTLGRGTTVTLELPAEPVEEPSPTPLA